MNDDTMELIKRQIALAACAIVWLAAVGFY